MAGGWMSDVALAGPSVSNRVRWILWFLYVAAWSAALLTSHPVKVAGSVLPDDTIRFITAKSLHVAAYFVLTVLTAWQRVPRPWMWLLLTFLTFHALATEGLQNFVPLRSGTWADVAIDHIGIVLGLIVTWKWWLVNRAATSSDRSARG